MRKSRYPPLGCSSRHQIPTPSILEEEVEGQALQMKRGRYFNLGVFQIRVEKERKEATDAEASRDEQARQTGLGNRGLAGFGRKRPGFAGSVRGRESRRTGPLCPRPACIAREASRYPAHHRSARVDDDLDLIDTVTELRDAHGVNASYNQLYKACLDGMVPGVRVRGRWRLRRADLPRIATTLGRNRQPARAKPSERTPAAA
jgi:hypothetical protein